MRSKPISYTTNLWILPLLMAIFSVSLQAQKPGKDSWDNLNRLQPGQKVQLVQMDMKSLKGKFLGFTDEMISLRTKKDEVAVPREDVFRVSLREKPNRGRNLLIGVGIGAVAAIVFNTAGNKALDSPPREDLAIHTAIGAGIGAGIGAAFPHYETIYRVKRIKRGKGQ